MSWYIVADMGKFDQPLYECATREVAQYTISQFEKITDVPLAMVEEYRHLGFSVRTDSVITDFFID